MRRAREQLEDLAVAKHTLALRRGFRVWPELGFVPPALGDARWTPELILSTWVQAESGRPPEGGLEHRVGRSGGGFDRLDFAFLPAKDQLAEGEPVDTSIALGRRGGHQLEIPIPWYGAGMSYGSVSERIMLAALLTSELAR